MFLCRIPGYLKVSVATAVVYQTMTETKSRFTEDELATAITNSIGDENTTWKPEVHYNHYGDRGVVDLVCESTVDGFNMLRVFELKCQAAIDEATGANEILRQFNRHRSYFFDGSDYKATDYDEVAFELCFAATKPCYEHVSENWAQYKYVADEKDGRVRTQILYRTPECPDPFIPRKGGVLPSHNLEDVDGFNPEVVR